LPVTAAGGFTDGESAEAVKLRVQDYSQALAIGWDYILEFAISKLHAERWVEPHQALVRGVLPGT
jgi:hypothetical protein